MVADSTPTTPAPNRQRVLLAKAVVPSVVSITSTRNTRGSEYPRRLVNRLISGDESGSWTVIEGALIAGMEPDEVYLDLLRPALRQRLLGPLDPEERVAVLVGPGGGERPRD